MCRHSYAKALYNLGRDGPWQRTRRRLGVSALKVQLETAG